MFLRDCHLRRVATTSPDLERSVGQLYAVTVAAEATFSEPGLLVSANSMEGLGDLETVPLSAVPILLQIISQPDHASRGDTLSLLCDLVSSAYDDDGEAIGGAIRESGGLLTLSWLLAEPDVDIQKQTLEIQIFSDSDHASVFGRRSTGANATLFTGEGGSKGLVDFGSKVQHSVTRSSGEAETTQLGETVKGLADTSINDD